MTEAVIAPAEPDYPPDARARELRIRSEPNPAGSPGPDPTELRLLDLFAILCSRKHVIARTTLAAGILAAAAAFLLPNRYKATATILPPQQSPSLASSLIGQMGGLAPVASLAQKDLGLKNPGDLYVGMLRSRTAEDALIRRFDLLRVYGDKKMSEARQDLEKTSSIALLKEGLVSIAVEDRDPRRAYQIANAYVDELRRMTQDLAVTEEIVLAVER